MSLEAGVSKVCITPPLGILMGGIFIRPKAESVHDDLWAKCLFLRNGESQAALVTCDLLGITYSTIDRVYDKISKTTGLRRDQFVVSCTHNHSGPDTNGGIHDLMDDPYIDELVEKIAAVVDQAYRNLQPAKAGFGTAELDGVCSNRRIRMKDGTVRMNWSKIPEDQLAGYGPIDPMLGVLRVDTADGKPLAAVIHYTCHAAVVSPAPKQISADYPGYACRMVERLVGDGITAMFVNGAFGNINHILKPAEFNAMAAGTAADRPFEEAERVGQTVAAAALKILPDIATADVSLATAYRYFPMGLRNPPLKDIVEAQKTVDDMRFQLADAQKAGDQKQIDQAVISLTYAEHWLAFFRRGHTTAEIRLSAMRIGDLALACISGEPFVEIGFEIKRNSPFPTTWVLGNTNGYSGYIPTEESFAQGGYEVQTCGWSKWRTDADAIVAEEALRLLRSVAPLPLLSGEGVGG